MALVKFNSRPFGRDKHFPNTFDSLFNGFMHDMDKEVRSFRPHVDILESDQAFTLEVTLPGMKKEDIKIDLEKNVLTISGERHERKEDKSGKVIRVESNYGQFTRSFNLPDEVNADKASAQFEDGILHITLPKTEAKKSRSISIK